MLAWYVEGLGERGRGTHGGTGGGAAGVRGWLGGPREHDRDTTTGTTVADAPEMSRLGRDRQQEAV